GSARHSSTAWCRGAPDLKILRRAVLLLARPAPPRLDKERVNQLLRVAARRQGDRALLFPLRPSSVPTKVAVLPVPGRVGWGADLRPAASVEDLAALGEAPCHAQLAGESFDVEPRWQAPLPVDLDGHAAAAPQPVERVLAAPAQEGEWSLAERQLSR